MSGPRPETHDARPIPMEQTRPLRQAVLRPLNTLEELADSELPDSQAFAVFEDGAIVAVGFVGRDEEPGVWRVRGMATAEHLRGRGAGSAVLRRLIEHAEAQGATRILCWARTPAITFYERAGFTVRSEVFDVPPAGPHVIMARD